MRRFVEGADRGQTTLLPECLGDWVEESNPVRAVDESVGAVQWTKPVGKSGSEAPFGETSRQSTLNAPYLSRSHLCPVPASAGWPLGQGRAVRRETHGISGLGMVVQQVVGYRNCCGPSAPLGEHRGRDDAAGTRVTREAKLSFR